MTSIQEIQEAAQVIAATGFDLSGEMNEVMVQDSVEKAVWMAEELSYALDVARDKTATKTIAATKISPEVKAAQKAIKAAYNKLPRSPFDDLSFGPMTMNEANQILETGIAADILGVKDHEVKFAPNQNNSTPVRFAKNLQHVYSGNKKLTSFEVHNDKDGYQETLTVSGFLKTAKGVESKYKKENGYSI